MRRVGWLIAGVCCAAAAANAEERVGVLVLAHGGEPRWNAAVTETVGGAALPWPAEIAFGMGMHADEAARLQEAVSALERRGAGRIVAVPLLISSHSMIIRQYAYLLGLRADGPWMEHAAPIDVRVPVTLTRALDDAAVVAEIVADRAREVSREPASEIVVLVAHGPNEEADQARWLAAMERIGAAVSAREGFRRVIPVTMRDDAPEAVLEEAVRRLRETVARGAEDARVLVVPLLIANGGIEHKIRERLDGLPCVIQERALLPDARVGAWLAERVRAALDADADGFAGGDLAAASDARAARAEHHRGRSGSAHVHSVSSVKADGRSRAVIE
ncbi:MAG TPA: hypothetical protein VGB20_06345 [bacterium]